MHTGGQSRCLSQQLRVRSTAEEDHPLCPSSLLQALRELHPGSIGQIDVQDRAVEHALRYQLDRPPYAPGLLDRPAMRSQGARDSATHRRFVFHDEHSDHRTSHSRQQTSSYEFTGLY